MWGKISRHWQIVAATLFSVMLVIGTYLFVRGVDSPQVAQASTETALLQAIATKDSNGDGLPDWQKSLYGIPLTSTTTDYFHLGMTDGEAVAKGLIVPIAIANLPEATSSGASVLVDPSLPPAPAPGTLTAAFAQNFFGLYIAAKQANGGANLSESQTSDIANQAINTLSSSLKTAPDFKAASDLTVSGTGTDAMTTFAANAEAILLKNTSDATTTDLNYFKGAILNNDTTAFAHLTAMAKMYRDSATGLARLQVPQELAASDLLLINTLMRMSEIDDDFTRATTDPLVAILALQQYTQASVSLGKAFIDIGNLYATANISIPNDTPGASFVNMIANIKNQQAGVKKP